MVEPLTHAQKTFNQRLLAEHVLTESQARALWNNLQAEDEDEEDELTLEEAVATCNASLQYLGLEIAAVSLKKRASEEQEEDPSSQGSTQSSGSKFVRHYALINKFPDEIAKKSFAHSFHKSQYAYVKKVLETLVASGNEEDEDEDDNRHATPPYMATRSTLINLRTELPEPHNKLALDPTERALDQLLQQGWLVEQKVAVAGGRKKRLVGIGARTYLELSYMLEELGMDPQDLPQQIYHRL